MALEFVDGFDHYSSAGVPRKWDVGSSSQAFQTGRFGGLAAYASGSGPLTATKTLTAVTTRVMGFAFSISGLVNAVIAQFMDAGTTQVELRITSTGALQVTRNANVLATSANVILINTWYYIEWKILIGAGTSGSYQLRVNGADVIASTAGNTQNTVNATMNQARISGNNSASFYFDDLYVLNTSGSVNNDFLGECRILSNIPTGDSGTSGNKTLSVSTGTNHYANVDEIPPNDDTDYNYSSTPGQIDTYTRAAISPTGAIAGVQTTLCARKDDTGTRQICEECRSGGANYDGANTFTMNSTYGMFCEIREKDPATNAAWTASGVNAAAFGAKVVA